MFFAVRKGLCSNIPFRKFKPRIPPFYARVREIRGNEKKFAEMEKCV